MDAQHNQTTSNVAAIAPSSPASSLTTMMELLAAIRHVSVEDSSRGRRRRRDRGG